MLNMKQRMKVRGRCAGPGGPAERGEVWVLSLFVLGVSRILLCCRWMYYGDVICSSPGYPTSTRSCGDRGVARYCVRAVDGD